MLELEDTYYQRSWPCTHKTHPPTNTPSMIFRLRSERHRGGKRGERRCSMGRFQRTEESNGRAGSGRPWERATWNYGKGSESRIIVVELSKGRRTTTLCPSHKIITHQSIPPRHFVYVHVHVCVLDCLFALLKRSNLLLLLTGTRQAPSSVSLLLQSMDLFTTTASSWKALLSSSLSSSPPPLPAHYKIKKTSQSDALHDKDPSSSSSLIFSRSESSPPQERMTKPSSSLLLYKATTSLSSSSQSPSDSNGSSSSCSPCGTTPTHDDRDDEEDCHDPALPTRTRTTTTTRTTTLHHARLDGSLQCCQCHASHALYLMYPIVKTFETWNLENQYLCALCHDDDEDDNAKANDNAKDEQGRRLHAQEQEDPLHTPHGRSTPLWAHTNSSSSSNNNSKKKQPEQGKHQPLFLLTASSSSSSAALPPTHDGDRRRPTQIPLISQDSCDVQECLDLLHEVEEEREKAMERCTPLAIEELQHVMRQELLHLPPTSYVAHSHSRSRKMSSSSSSALSASASIQSIVDRDTKIYMDLWQRHWDLLAETVVVLQHALEVQGDDACDIVLAYYQWRSRPHPSRPLEETPKRRRGVTGTPPTTTTEPAWKLTADQALNQRDIEAGVGPGHFWGSSSSLCTSH